MPDPGGTKNDEKGVDALEHLAYLIAEEFVREVHKRFATHLLRDSAGGALLHKEISGEPEVDALRGEPKVFVARGGGNAGRSGF